MVMQNDYLKCDILIIGGGPAGLSAASFLSKKGYSLIIVEKDTIFGSKKTKYEITEGKKISKIISEIGIKPNKKSSKIEWESQNIDYIHNSDIVHFYFKRGPDEDSIEKTLLKKIGENVRIFSKSTVDNINNTCHLSFVKISTPEGKKTIAPRFIIISDGSESEWRRNMDIKTQIFNKYYGLGVVVETNEKNMIPHLKVCFDENITTKGYLYSGSVNNDTFYCIVEEDKFTSGENLKKKLALIIKKNIVCDYKIKNCYSEIGSSGIQETIKNNIFFIGGAANFFDPLIIHGLNHAIESAYYVAKAIESDNLDIYKEYTKEVQDSIKIMYHLGEKWRKSENSFFNNLIQSISEVYNKKTEKIKNIVNIS